jgi:UBX domain-containing protein 1
MSNIHGLHSGNRADANKKQNDEEFSLGGATSSTAVYRPTNGVMREVIEKARKQSSSPIASSSSGWTNDRSIGLITIYSNGFMIGNGPFRDINDPKNAAFIKDLKNGDVPKEMIKLCQEEWGADIDSVNVQLSDHSSEVYTPPKPKFSFAESKGQSLGSASGSTTNLEAFQTLTPQPLNIDNSQPTGTIQIALADRRRLRETVNHTTTVRDIYRHILYLTNAATRFELVAGFPPKVLSDPNVTVKDAGIIGAQIQQRLLP